MSTSLLEQVIRLENQDELHSVRLLILINTLTGRKNETSIFITTLAKLDFILRYPVVLERALKLINVVKNAAIHEAERNSIESEMLAFSYSPWSSDFRRLLVLLSARSLITWRLDGRQIELKLTSLGMKLNDELASRVEFSEILQQSKIIKTNFSTLSNAKLDSLLVSIIKYTTVNTKGGK
jgi:hypothetical protein